MKIIQTAMAGTLESSDVQIILSEGSNGITIDLESQVLEQFGTQIKQVIKEILDIYNITDATVKVVDKGALDCVIKARLTAAIHRSLGTQHAVTPWEV